MTARAVAVLASIAVYDDRTTHLGEVAELGNGQFRATDSFGEQISILFDTWADARSAVVQASSMQTDTGK